MTYTTVATQLTERDYSLLSGLFESRVMTIAHAADLYFAGNQDTARKRVWKLKNAWLVTERTRQRQYDPSILYLTRLGFEHLVSAHRLDRYPTIGWPAMEKRTQVSPLTLQHELDVMSVKCAISRAANATEKFKIAEFSTWPRLFAFPVKPFKSHSRSRSGWMKPDAFIRVREIDGDGFDDATHLFYLELDRSTESHSRLQVKADAYVEHYRSGGMPRRFGAPVGDFARFPFRVLFVCKTLERRNNIARAMLRRHPPILTMLWLTTFDELRHDPLGKIWVRSIDYRDATKNTLFDPHQPNGEDIYRRKAAREEAIDLTITKHVLLT